VSRWSWSGLERVVCDARSSRRLDTSRAMLVRENAGSGEAEGRNRGEGRFPVRYTSPCRRKQNHRLLCGALRCEVALLSRNIGAPRSPKQRTGQAVSRKLAR